MTEVSMRDTLEKAMEDIEDRVEEEETPEPEAKPEPAQAEPAEEEGEKPETPDPVAPVAKTESKPESKTTEAPDPHLVNPPSTWTAKGKSLWGTLPPDVKKEIKKREGDAAEGIRKIKEASAFGDRVSKTITPYQAFLKSRNVAPEVAIENALNLAYSLSSGTPQQKGAIIRSIAQQYGADLSVPDQKSDPLDQKLAPLLSKIEQLERERQNSQTLSKQQQDVQLQSHIDAFASETDETGQLLHPYFDNVAALMSSLLDSGSASTLKDAYALAVETHPQTRDIIRASNAQKESERKQAEARERAAKLKRNNQVNFIQKPSHTSSKTAAQGSMRETIESTYESLNAS